MIESLLPTRLTARQKKEAERKRKEAAARKKREAEAKKRLAESRRRRDEALRRAAEDRRKREEAARKKREAEAKRRREEEARRKREAEAKRKREEEARLKREEEARRRREEAEANRPKPPVVTPPVVTEPEPDPEPEPEPDPNDGTGTDPGDTEDPDTTLPGTEDPEGTEPDPTDTETAGPEPEEPPSSPDEEPEEGEVLEPEPRHYFDSQVDFSSSQNEQNNPVTEFKKTPDVFYDVSFYGTDLRFDDGVEVEMWSFETDNQREQFPGPLARVREGQIFQAHFKPSKGNHPIHWHGLEPDPRNDGVGHTSFEIAGEYTYQWQPEKGRPGEPNWGTAGTYFYHCHVNTTLHVQMGMFAPLIIDPIVHPDYPVSPGARRAFVDGPEYDIDTETLMVPYSMATPWHEKHHAAGLSGEDAGLNHFRPNHFYLLGGELARRPNRRESVWSLKSMRANVKGGSKKPTLLRLLNANYLPMVLRFLDSNGNPVQMAECIAHDGRPFRDTHDPKGPSKPCRDAGYPMMTSLLRCGSAERWDLLLEPPYAGEYQVVVEFRHWITDEILGQKSIKLVAS